MNIVTVYNNGDYMRTFIKSLAAHRFLKEYGLAFICSTDPNTFENFYSIAIPTLRDGKFFAIDLKDILDTIFKPHEVYPRQIQVLIEDFPEHQTLKTQDGDFWFKEASDMIDSVHIIMKYKRYLSKIFDR